MLSACCISTLQMMWNWAAAVLSVEGAALVAFDGSPGHPDLAALWRVSAEEGVTHLGASPKYAQRLYSLTVSVLHGLFRCSLNWLFIWMFEALVGVRDGVPVCSPHLNPVRALTPATYRSRLWLAFVGRRAGTSVRASRRALFLRWIAPQTGRMAWRTCARYCRPGLLCCRSTSSGSTRCVNMKRREKCPARC